MKIGPYEIGPALGVGTAAEYFLGKDAANKVMVVKRLNDDLARNARVSDRFLAACDLTAKIRDKRFLATVVMKTKSADGTFLIREHVAGRSLAKHHQEGRLAELDAKQIAFDLCDALRALHQHGIVHGGIHPGNIVIDNQGRLRLMDYAIGRASLTGQIDPDYPLSALRYLAPEQWAGQSPGVAADLYAAGLIVALLVEHRELAPAPSFAAIKAQVLSGLKVHCAELAQAVALDRAHRYRDADQMRAALAAMFDPATPPMKSAAKARWRLPATSAGSLQTMTDLKGGANLLALNGQSWRLTRTIDPQQWPVYFTNGGPGELQLHLSCQGPGIRLTPTDQLTILPGQSRYVIVVLDVHGSDEVSLDVAWGQQPSERVSIPIHRPSPKTV